MPIYEFECVECGTCFESIVRSTAAVDQVTCSQCKSRNVKKTISAGSYRFGGRSPATTSSASGCASKSGFT